MEIKEKLTEAMRAAMKANDDVARRTTRMALAAIQQVEVDRQTKVNDAAVMGLLQKEIKNRREAIEEGRKANRSDLIADNEAEIKVLEAFLPKAMPAEELRQLAQTAIGDEGAHAAGGRPGSRRPGERHGQGTAYPVKPEASPESYTRVP